MANQDTPSTEDGVSGLVWQFISEGAHSISEQEEGCMSVEKQDLVKLGGGVGFIQLPIWPQPE
jgi:hypothetical protein